MSAIENLQEYISKIQPLGSEWKSKIEGYLKRLAIPEGGLGDLMDVAIQMAATSKKLTPQLHSKCVVIIAADHGIADEGVSSIPRVTDKLVKNILNGEAAVNIVAESSDCDIKVVDMGVCGDLKECVKNDNFFSKYINKTGTANFLNGPAMTAEDCMQSILTGIEVAEGLSHRYDIFGVGDAGIGNTTSAAAIASVVLGVDAKDVTILQRGLTKKHWEHKCEVVEKAVKFHKLKSTDSLVKIMTAVGGYEIAALIGMILGAAACKKLILIDGFTTSVAALCAKKICPQVTDYLIASHRTSEPGHALILSKLNKKPLLKLNLGMVQGVGIPLAFNLMKNTAELMGGLHSLDELIGE